MNCLKILLGLIVIPFFALKSLSAGPIKTDYAIFLFDNGEKNFVASMLSYAEAHDPNKLEALDFRIVFMGASVDAMKQEPFCHFSDKLIHYKDLGIKEIIDRNWVRNAEISKVSLESLSSSLQVCQKAWFGVSCSVFGQMINELQKDQNLEVLAIRDNPNASGDTDYFTVARQVQDIAHKIAVPSADAAKTLSSDKQVIIVGHPPLEEYVAQVNSLNKTAIIHKLGLEDSKPVIVYAGVYGPFYEEAFKQFLSLLQSDGVVSSDIQVIVVPHPRFKGAEEKRLCKALDIATKKRIQIIGEFEELESQKAKTVEALAIADVVVTADATSTIVAQAKALGKTVLYVNPKSSQVSQDLCDKGILQRLVQPEDLVQAAESTRNQPGLIEQSIFEMLGIPREGARLLWEVFTDPSHT